MRAWQPPEVHQILLWAESGSLSAQQVAQLAALSPLHAPRAAWLAAGARLCTLAGAVLLAGAVIFFFAYNWDALDRLAKLGLAVSAFVACVLVALRTRAGGLGWQAALLAAMLCTGALLALIGQIYQTGADIWELFAAWSALMLPFALLARAWPHWLLCIAVSNLWITRMLVQDGGLWHIGIQSEEAKLALWLGLNILWWFAAQWGTGLLLVQARGQTILARTAATLALTALTLGAIQGVFLLKLDAVHSAFVIYIPLFIAVASGGFWFYRYYRLDIVMLGILGSCAVLVAATLPARGVFRSDNTAISLLAIAVLITVAAGGLSIYLKNLVRGTRVPMTESAS